MNARKPAIAATLALLLSLPSCGGGTVTATSSSVSIVLTDAASDELEMFEVDVESIVLQKSDGSTATALDKKVRVDFAQLELLGELIGGVDLGAGTYTGLTMRLDFTSAQVCIVGATTPATIVDAGGSLITGDVDLQVSLPASLRPSMTASRNHVVVLDLDLDQAVVVDSGSNQISFSPVVKVSVDPLTPKPITMSGLLTSVDTSSMLMTIQKRTPGGEDVGTFEIEATASTVFQIDGITLAAGPGLTAMAAMASGTPRIYVQGTTLRSSERKLVATIVETGLGTPGNGQDWVSGHIVARDNGAGSDATLSVLGSSYDDSTGTRQFGRVHTVAVSNTQTKVVQRGMSSALDTDALNVGQRVQIFGTLTGTAMDATSISSIARMLATSMYGEAAATPSGNTLTLNVTRIDLRSIGAFNFTVGGVSQATPTAMDVAVDGVDGIDTITSGMPVRPIGHFAPVSSSSSIDDFDANSVEKQPAGRLLVAQWSPPSATAFSSISSNGLDLDVSSASHAVISDGFTSTAVSASPGPAVQPLLNIGLFIIVEDGTLQVFVDFDEFQTALSSRVSSTSPVFRMAAAGPYDTGTQTVRAVAVTVVLR
ncbi:MAG: DUF4382 domain-containing protein [Planctomycetota bacterium]